MHLPWRDVAPYEGAALVSTSLLAEDAAELARLADSQHVLEIGSAYGYSAAVMLHAGALSVTAIDPHTWIPGSFESFKQVADGASCIRKTSQTAMQQLAEHHHQFGLIFIDGDHTAAAVDSDLTWAMELLAPGGAIAVHDYLEDCCCPDVRRVVDQLYPGEGKIVGSMWVWEQ